MPRPKPLAVSPYGCRRYPRNDRQCIEALHDRIDVIVQALAFNPRFLDELLLRIEENVRPEEVAPREIIFTEHEIDRMVEEIREVAVPHDVRRRLLDETAGELAAATTVQKYIHLRFGDATHGRIRAGENQSASG